MQATRDGFGDQLISMPDDDIIVVNADLGKSTRANKFKEVHPDRFIEVGIAEANMIGVASGLSEYGFKVVISSFASFITGRYDIIRCSLAYPNCPVVIAGSHSGMAIGRDGVTQMGLEDVNLMRGLPNIHIFQPATYIEAKHITEYAINSNRLTYIRLGRQPVHEYFDRSYKFQPQLGQILRVGKQVAVLSTGCVLETAFNVAERVDGTVVNIHTLKPLDTHLIGFILHRYNLVVTIEDHSIVGGLGSGVAEISSEIDSKAKLLRIGINDQFVESGEPDDLYNKYNINENAIVEKIKSILSS